MQAARRKGLVVNPAMAKIALRGNVGKQIFARPPRSTGQSAAEQPGSRLQADLIDFSKNTKSKGYAEVVTDVFTRRSWAEPLKTKDAESVKAATEKILHKVPHVPDPVISTDQGKEFFSIDTIPGVIHRTKVNGEVNSIAVVDRRIALLKQYLARDAVKGTVDWKSQLQPATAALNDNYTAAVHGAPDDVKLEDGNIQGFLALQDEARHFAHNKAVVDKKKADLELAGAFRPPVSSGGRSFKPTYGEVRQLAGVDPGARFITDTSGRKSLLSLAQPVDKTSAEAQGSLTLKTKYAPRPRVHERASGAPMKRQIPLAAGQPLEGPRHRVRAPKPKAAKVSKPPLEPIPEERSTQGGSSSSKTVSGAPRGTMAALIANQKASYVPKRTMAQIQAEAASKKAAKQVAKEAEKARLDQIRAENKRDIKALMAQEREREKKAKASKK